MARQFAQVSQHVKQRCLQGPLDASGNIHVPGCDLIPWISGRSEYSGELSERSGIPGCFIEACCRGNHRYREFSFWLQLDDFKKSIAIAPRVATASEAHYLVFVS